MPGCCSWNCFGICRSRRRRSPSWGPQPGAGADGPIELQDIPSPAISANNPVVTQADPASDRYQYGEREMWGELRQRWIDDANEPKCKVTPVNFEYKDLTHTTRRSQKWTTTFNRWGPGPPVLRNDLRNCRLPTGEQDYHDAKITKLATKRHPKRGSGTNCHHITTAMGVVIVRKVERYDGLHWSQVAHAQYNTHFDQNTLRHIYLENVINEDTRDFIQTIWAKTQPDNSPGFQLAPASLNQLAWAYDTPEYKAILGTELGKGVAALVLSAFPRGTRRITKIVVWRQAIMQIRFDIEHKDYLDRAMDLDESRSDCGSSG
ncbi:hypothetical protein N7517_011320 [Penicillium concentricum]|uniref:Uncharacterized protein n=1 Tax=Penicillium concentricum TaxID=293559 RepID=A0A9W9UVX3_9EURO|nr:uncharacterized protein N7517_011320 [Penicillium concentricum]KAJ5356711.1 hypothetical protein N7517_011320 [Penicillium concentricum]